MITTHPLLPRRSLQQPHATSLLSCNAKCSEHKLSSARGACICRNSVGDDTGVGVAVDDAYCGHVAEVALPNGGEVAYWVGEEDQVWEITAILDCWESKAFVSSEPKE